MALGLAREIRPDRVAIYIRWSTEDQGDGTTLVVQQEGCQHYVRSQGWAVTPSLVFIDDGYSGGTLDRPKMTELRQAVKAGDVDCVVVYKLDRLSRSVMDTVNLVLDEWDGRTHLKSAREPIDTTSPMGKQFFYMLVSYAEWERNVIKDRTFSGKLRRAKEGKNPGIPASFGYRKGEHPGTFEIDPEKAELVRWIFRKYLEECGTFRLAGELNQMGIPSPTGIEWNKTTVCRLLKNPIYTGVLMYGRTTTNPRRQRNKSEPLYLTNPDPIVAQGHFPPIIDVNTFERVQALMSQRHRGATGVRHLASDYLLTGILKCQCGSALNSHVMTRKGKEYRYYICQGKAHKGTTWCECAGIPMQALDTVVEDKLLELLRSEESYRQFLGARHKGLHEQLRAVSAQRRQVAVTLESKEDELRRISRDYRQGHISPITYEENKQEIETERSQLRGQVAELERQERLVRARLGDEDTLQEIVDLAKRWFELDMAKKKFILRNVVERVVAYKARGSAEVQAEVVWKFAEPK